VAYEFEAREAVGAAARRVALEQVTAALAWLGVAAGDDPGPATAAEVAHVDGDGADGDGPEGGDGDGREGNLDDAVARHVASEVDPEASVEEAVHEARKCCKRIRGVARLVRPAMEEEYHATNAAARDAARHLSPIRDAHALLATFDDLVAARADQLPEGGVAGVRAVLADRAAEATEHVTSNLERITAARDLLGSARTTIREWPLDDLSPEAALDAMAAGIAKTAGRGAKRFDDVASTEGHPADELLHQWRKRTKYSWYHVSLLEPAAVALLGAHADALHDLSDALGDDHDLAILAADLLDPTSEFDDDREVQAALVLIDGTRRDLQRRAISLGARLHAEDAVAMGTRMAAFVAAWHRHGPELRAGEISDLHGSVDELADRTNAELRDIARTVDLPGRSRMDREELLASLRAAGAR
jgi:CHAD domain-containing protein